MLGYQACFFSPSVTVWRGGEKLEVGKLRKLGSMALVRARIDT